MAPSRDGGSGRDPATGPAAAHRTVALPDEGPCELPLIGWDDFERVVIVAGTVTRVEPFPEARKPAWKVWVDFGPYGTKKTSAQVRALYEAESLIGRQVVGVINFPPKQIGPFRSEFLLTGFHTEEGVVLTAVERPVPNGTRLA